MQSFFVLSEDQTVRTDYQRVKLTTLREMDLVDWAHLNQTLRLPHLYYLRFTGICVCSCHVSLFLEVSFNVPPHYVAVFARCDYPVLPFTAVLALQSLRTAMTDLIEYRQLSVF